MLKRAELLRLASSWTEKRVFTVPIDDLTGLVKLRYREVGQEPYKETSQTLLF